MSANNVRECSKSLSIDSSIYESDSEEADLQLFVRKSLKSKLFVGNFFEKRRVEGTNAYKDVVQVLCSETEFKSKLKQVLTRLNEFYDNHVWKPICMVPSKDTFNIWTSVPDMPFGKYWFQVKTIKYLPREIIVHVKCLRPYTQLDEQSHQMPNLGSSESRTTVDDIDWTRVWQDFKQSTNENAYYFFTKVLTLRNTATAIKVTLVLITAILTGAVELFKFFLEFLPKFIREVGLLMQVITPFYLALIQLISKIVGGFFIVVASLKSSPKPVESYRRVGYTRKDSRHANEFNCEHYS